MSATIDTNLAALRLLCADSRHIDAIEQEVANLRADVAVFKTQRDVAQAAERRSEQKAEANRDKWMEEYTAKCKAQSECAHAREALRSLVGEVARWPR